jgi:hypothetical protein
MLTLRRRKMQRVMKKEREKVSRVMKKVKVVGEKKK